MGDASPAISQEEEDMMLEESELPSGISTLGDCELLSEGAVNGSNNHDEFIIDKRPSTDFITDTIIDDNEITIVPHTESSTIQPPPLLPQSNSTSSSSIPPPTVTDAAPGTIDTKTGTDTAPGTTDAAPGTMDTAPGTTDAPPGTTDAGNGSNMAMLQAWYEQQQQHWAAMAQHAPPGTAPPFYPGYPSDPSYYYGYQNWIQQQQANAAQVPDGAPGEKSIAVTHAQSGNAVSAITQPPSTSSSSTMAVTSQEPPWKRERMDRVNNNNSSGNNKSNNQSQKQQPQPQRPPSPAPNQFGGPYSVQYQSTSSDIAKLPTGSRLFIGNMASEKTSRDELGKLFCKYGNIKEILMKASYAFVQFDNPEACKLAVQYEQGRLLGGLNLDLKQSRDKPLPGQNRDQLVNPSDDQRKDHDHSRNRGPGRSSSNTASDHRDSHDAGGSGPIRNKFGSNRDDRTPYSTSSSSSRSSGNSGNRYDSRRNDDHDRHSGSGRRDDRDHRRDSPDRRGSRYSSPPSTHPSDLIPKRYGSRVPEVQILALGDVDKKYTSSVETIAKSAGMTVDTVRVPRDVSLRIVVQQLTEEGVLAAVFVETYHERDQAISMQILGGPNANTEYNGIRAVTMPNILMKERNARNAAITQGNKVMNAQKNNYGAPPNQPYYSNQVPQQAYYGQPPMQSQPTAQNNPIANALLATLPPHIIAMLPNGGIGLDQGVLIALVTAHTGGSLTPQQMAIIASAAGGTSANGNMPVGNTPPMGPGMQQLGYQQYPQQPQQPQQPQRTMMAPVAAPQPSNMGNPWNSNPNNSIPTLSGYGAPQQASYGLPPQQQGGQINYSSVLPGIPSMNPLASGVMPSGTPSVSGMLEQLKQLQTLASMQGGGNMHK